MDITPITLIIAILGSVMGVLNLYLSRRDKAVKDAKDDAKDNNTPLIEYQLKELKDYYKEIATDVKKIRESLDDIKENIRSEIRVAMEDHIRQYHSKEK